MIQTRIAILLLFRRRSGLEGKSSILRRAIVILSNRKAGRVYHPWIIRGFYLVAAETFLGDGNEGPAGWSAHVDEQWKRTPRSSSLLCHTEWRGEKDLDGAHSSPSINKILSLYTCHFDVLMRSIIIPFLLHFDHSIIPYYLLGAGITLAIIFSTWMPRRGSEFNFPKVSRQDEAHSWKWRLQ